MKQPTNDVIFKCITEWTQYEVKHNWDSDADTLVRSFADIMHNMTFTIPQIIDSLRATADELERECELVSKDMSEVEFIDSENDK